MKQPLLHEEIPFSPVWSGFHDASLRPALTVIKDGSGYRPATPSDFAGTSAGLGVTGGYIGISGTAQVSGNFNETTSPTFAAAADIIVTNTGAATQGSSVVCSKGALVTAFPTNSGNVYIGGSTVTNGNGNRRGLLLMQAGMPPMILPVGNVNQIYVAADYSGDGVGVLAI